MNGLVEKGLELLIIVQNAKKEESQLALLTVRFLYKKEKENTIIFFLFFSFIRDFTKPLISSRSGLRCEYVSSYFCLDQLAFSSNLLSSHLSKELEAGSSCISFILLNRHLSSFFKDKA